MVSARIYIEGGESKEDQIRCREGFCKLLGKAGFAKRMPRLSACGGRNSAFDDFKTAHASPKTGDYVALLVDSEDPVKDIEKTWSHLFARDGWTRPDGASDEQVLLMTTCMGTWIVADRASMKEHYRQHLQESALPALFDLEKRDRHDVQDKLFHATRNCPNAYAKGKRSFEILGKVDPTVLELHLPSFVRVLRVLRNRL